MLPFLDKVFDQGYPQSGLNINLHLTAVLFYKSIIKNSVTLFFMGLVQTKYGGMFPAQTPVWVSHRPLDLGWNQYHSVSSQNIPAPLLSLLQYIRNLN